MEVPEWASDCLGAIELRLEGLNTDVEAEYSFEFGRVEVRVEAPNQSFFVTEEVYHSPAFHDLLMIRANRLEELYGH